MEIHSEADIPSETFRAPALSHWSEGGFFMALTHQQQTLEINAQEKKKGPSGKKQGVEKQAIFNT